MSLLSHTFPLNLQGKMPPHHPLALLVRDRKSRAQPEGLFLWTLPIFSFLEMCQFIFPCSWKCWRSCVLEFLTFPETLLVWFSICDLFCNSGVFFLLFKKKWILLLLFLCYSFCKLLLIESWSFCWISMLATSSEIFPCFYSFLFKNSEMV